MTRFSALLFASLLSAAAHAVAPAAPIFGQPLACKPGMQTSVLAASKGFPDFVASAADLTWTLDAMKRIGYEAQPPKAEQARAAATTAAALAHQGYLVAAKMAKDEATSNVAGFRASPFSASFEALLTVLTQPVSHASYPTSVRADGETREASSGRGHSHGADLEDMSALLKEVISRAETSKQAMGKTYANPSVRFYLLAHGFRDPVALQVATAQVCAEKLDEETVRKLNVSARFMAMPTSSEASTGAAK